MPMLNEYVVNVEIKKVVKDKGRSDKVSWLVSE
jgi:hypothetical protein